MVGAIVTMKRKASKAFLDSQPGGAQPKKQHGELGSNVDDHNEALNATEDSDVVMNEEIHDYGSVLAREESDIDMDEAPYERALGLGGRMIPREDSMEIDSEGENGMDTDTNMNLDNEPSSQDDLPARPPMREDPPDEASMVRGLKGKKPASKTKKKSTAPSAGDELNAQDDLPARPPTTEDPPDEASLARGLKGKKPAKEVEEKSIAPSAGDELNAQDDLPARPPTTEDPPDEASLARGLKGKKPAKEVEEKSIAPAVGNELNAQDDLEEVEEESTAPAAGKTKTGRGKQIKEYWGEMPDNERLKGVTLKNCINYNLAPLSDANAIFRDLTDLGVSNGLLGAVTDLDGMDIRVATMCSGTESPLLALGMICESLKDKYKMNLSINHCFSVEIVPRKQAYIERNFHPKYLFRDIREIGESKDGQATTAYGALVDIPKDIDMVIAGFPCVDFSTQNSKRKAMADLGESGEGLMAIVKYAQKARPATMILENVEQADWDLFKAVFENKEDFVSDSLGTTIAKQWLQWPLYEDGESSGYVAVKLLLDSKQFYIPQTRRRGYMFLVRKDLFSDEKAREVLQQTWVKMVHLMKRPTSVSTEAFLLPEGDPHLMKAQVDTSQIRIRGDVNWETCKERHRKYRIIKSLGFGRPMTQWTDRGNAVTPDYFWRHWAKVQVERLWDTWEIAHLRNAKKGYDDLYKLRVWELSQNVDRDEDSHPFGITGCITPSGQPFITTRGRPLVGREALALQGLPLNKLILTGESPRELQDLAGNAMTSTVVGAVTIAAIIAAKDALKRNILSRDPQPQTKSALQNPAIVVKTDSHYLDSDQPLAFEGTGEHTLQEIYDLAGQTGRKCHCEGLSQITTSKILVCKDCGHSACKDCGKIPVHDYKPSRLLSRSPPQNFQRVIQEYLPMRVVLKGLLETDFGSLVDKVKGQLSPGHPAIVESQLRQACETELQFRTTKRSQWWTAIYESASTRLEVTINEERACWYLYGKVNPTAGANDPNRQLLENPIARMKVQGDDIFQGSWQVCMPTFDAFEINITGKGSKVPSWQNSLELDRFEKDEVYSHLKIEYNTCPKVPLDQEICGLYKALPNCGAACASLHIKIPEDEAALGSDVMQVAATLTQDSDRKFFFLDPHKTGLPTDDRYVFSTDARRLEYQEQRPLVARLTSAWDPIAEGVTTVECEAKGEWVSCDASLRAFEGSERATYAMPRNDLALELFRKVSLDPLHPETLSYDCRTSAVVLLSFNVPLGNLVQHGTAEWWHSGDWQTVNAIDEREALQLVAWLIERPRGLAGFSKNLRMVALPQHLETCECCAPRLATTRWRLSKSGKIIPYEDGPEAGRYEQALKARPLPFIIRQRLNQGSHAQLQMAPNVSTLAHRAYGKLEDVSPDSRPSGFWGVNTHVELHPGNIFPQIKIKDTKELPKDEYEFPMNKLPKKELPKRLRPEQKRLLKWMIGQELEDAAPWKEQEVEEVAIPSLGWRVEYRARKETSVPGGVLADHVGFGKTPTILALHDKMKPVTDEEAKKPCDGSISLKATLVLVPPQLVNQWRDEIIKFLGSEYKILIVEGLKDLNKTTIADFESADFVIVSVDLLKSDSYWSKVALFANQPEGPSVGGRAFNVWHARVRAEIRKNVEELKKMTTPSKLAEFRQNLRAALHLAEKDENLLRLVPSKLTRGAKYEPYKGGSADQEMAADKIGEDGDAKNEDAEDETINTKCAEKKIAKDEATGDEGTRVEIGKAKAGKAKARKPKKAEQPPLTEEEERQAKIDRSYNAMFGLKETNGTNSTDPDIEAWKQMRCPSLEMFTFARMVIDEYTYILQKYYDLFRAIKAHRKWTLSGTPPLAGFPDIRRMAGLVDANLGVLDDNAGEVQHATLASTRNERSDAETFQAFGFSHTPDWHATRHQHAQRFVDQFVRQNAREIGELSVEYIIIPVRMYTTERIVYEELQHLLEDTDFEVGRGIQTQGQGDRGEQAGNLLKGCKSAPEALLKASSYFGKDVFKLTAENSNSLSDLERKGEIDLNNFSYIAFAGHLRHAVWLDKQIQRFWNDPKFEDMVESYGNLFEDWIISVQSGRSFHVAVTLEMLMKMAKDKYKFDHEEQFYRDEPDEAAKKKEKQEIRSKKAAAARAVKKAATDRIVYPGGGATEGKSIEPAVRHLPYKIPHDNLPQFIKALQSVIRQLQKDTGEVVSRYGKMRFARIARTLVARSKLDEPDKGVKRFDIDPCEVCGSSRNLSRLFINASCGHIICDSCLQKHRHIEHCVVKNCHVPAPRSRLRSLDDFEDTGEEDCEYGIKVDQIIALIQSIDDEDQVLLFVQYEELMNKLNDALNDKKIPHSGLFENKRSQAGRIVEKFKKNKEASRDKVLLLNSSNDTAAGANLINANHVIFLAPFDASSHYAYGASRTQCIGRALRYGQKKKVYVYDFLALKTFDVDVFEYREGKRLMKKTCGDSVEWSMVNPKGLTPEEELKLAESDPKDPITKGMDDQESLTSEGMVDQENLTEGVIDQENLTDEEMDDQESLTAEEKLEMGIFGCGYNYRFSDDVRDRDDLGDA